MPEMLIDEYQRLFALEDNLWLFKGIRRMVIGALVSRLRPSNVKPQLLDAGCGTGAMLDTLQTHGQPVGADLSLLAVKLCYQRGHREVSQTSITHLPFRDQAFDAVVSVDTLQCLAGDDDRMALREMWRVCRPGGYLLLWVTAHPMLYGPHDMATGAVRRFHRSEIWAKVRQAGFVIVKVSYANMFLFPAVLMAKMFRRFVPQWRRGQSDLVLPPQLINEILTSLLYLEGVFYRRTVLPLGLSLFVVGYRPE